MSYVASAHCAADGPALTLDCCMGYVLPRPTPSPIPAPVHRDLPQKQPALTKAPDIRVISSAAIPACGAALAGRALPVYF
jgi:hypothetical protein